MDSKITDAPIIDSPRSIVIPFEMEGLNESNMCDLNKVFQINFTYNVDLLKSLLEGILKFQKSAEEELEAIKEDNKEKNMKIRKLESKLSSLGGVSNPNLIKIDINDSKLDEKKQKKVENLLIPENDNENKARITIHNPRDDKIILETSESNSDIINKIIVSNKY